MFNLENAKAMMKHIDTFNLDLLDHTISLSKGAPTMSPEDTKDALVQLLLIAKNQNEVINLLIATLDVPKKTFMQKLFRK